MTTLIRRAEAADVPAMLDLAEQRRAEYARYQPRFWNPAPDARLARSGYFAQLVETEEVLTAVCVQDTQLIGFLIAHLVPAPPVYDPGGLTCQIDRFLPCLFREVDDCREAAVGAHLCPGSSTWRNPSSRRLRAPGPAETSYALLNRSNAGLRVVRSGAMRGTPPLIRIGTKCVVPQVWPRMCGTSLGGGPGDDAATTPLSRRGTDEDRADRPRAERTGALGAPSGHHPARGAGPDGSGDRPAPGHQ